MKSAVDVHVTIIAFVSHIDFASAIIPLVGHYVHTLVLIVSGSEHDF